MEFLEEHPGNEEFLIELPDGTSEVIRWWNSWMISKREILQEFLRLVGAGILLELPLEIFQEFLKNP